MKLNGKIISDKIEELYNFDKTLENRTPKQNSKLIDVKTNKDGDITPSKDLLITEEEYLDIKNKVELKVRQLGNEILKGNVDIKPYRYIENSKVKEYGCQYCEFKKICKFSENKNGYRFIYKKRK